MTTEEVPPRANAAPKIPAPVRPKHTVHWFRKGLRLHDNPALREGIEGATTFRCVFIIDPWFASSSNVGINKWRFLLNCLEDLDAGLKKVKSRLFVVRGQPADVLPKLFREWGTTVLSFEEDPEPYGRIRDYNISCKCREVGIKVISRISHTLYKLDKIIEKNGGKAPLTYQQFQALVANMPPPSQAEGALSVKTLNGTTTPISPDHDDRFGVPTLEELGFDTEGLKPAVWMGGETEALSRLKRHLETKTWLASLGRSKVPQSLMANPTGLTPYLRFGCLSTRLYYYQLMEVYMKEKKSPPPISLHGHLLWREFFYCAATRNPNFDRMDGNPICVQIPWDNNPTALAKWANGQTGFPWIDAIMSQLREEGWIHPLARHAVACFLTRGDLWISWEEGMKVFDELLLDTDWSVNAGMWMWWSCSSFFQQFFHCYCPVGFGRKADPNGEYIKRYVPALRHMPTRYIHEPWAAPEAAQRAARCIVGRDYPLPMLDHARAASINISRIKQVYEKLAKYSPQAYNIMQASKVRHLTKSWPAPNHPAVLLQAQINNTNQSDHGTGVIKHVPIKQVIIVSQDITPTDTSNLTTYTNASVNDLIVHSTQTTNATVNNPQGTPQSKKAHYDFKNLAITSKALEYANKFFKTSRNQQFYSPPPKKNYHKDQKYYAPNFLENCLNMLHPNEKEIIPPSGNRNQDADKNSKDLNASNDGYMEQDTASQKEENDNLSEDNENQQ